MKRKKPDPGHNRLCCKGHIIVKQKVRMSEISDMHKLNRNARQYKNDFIQPVLFQIAEATQAIYNHQL